MGTVLAQDILSDEPAPQNLVYNAADRDIDGYSNVEIERIAQESITHQNMQILHNQSHLHD